MRRVALLAAIGVAVLAGPVLADEADALVEQLNPVCAKPVTALTVAEIEQCHDLRRQIGRFVFMAHGAADAHQRAGGVRVIRGATGR